MKAAIDPRAFTPQDLAAAVRWVQQGGVLVYPTETFYALGVDPREEAAVAHVFSLKARTRGMALPLIAASIEQVERVCGPLEGGSARLAAVFWPGPLSLLLTAPPAIVPAVHAGTGAVAVRVPGHPLARALAAACGYPLTATSANRTGQPPANRPDALEALAADDRVLLLDAGSSPGGAPSTIVDARGAPPTLIREGAVPWKRVLESLEG